MVVAEVPLWVVHSNANAPGSIAQRNGNDSNGNASSNGAATGGACSRERATESLRLWTIGSGGGGTNGSGIGGVQRAAIYSIDFHGTKFATGGGDGTVRIWSAGALFPKPKSLVKSHFRRRETASTATANNANANNANANADGMDSTMQTTATASHQNQYESSGESSQDDEGSPASSPESNKSNNKSNNAHRTVRDLSSVVRRKGESAAPVSPSPAASDLPDASNININTDKNTTNSNNGNDTAANVAASGTSPTGGNNHRHHRLLCTLSAHTGSSVLAVRFSNHGKYLASAGDDAVVCVYAKQSGSNSLVARGNLESNHPEHWIRIKLCRGHGLDAVGLAWAPGDSHLVSCSLDSNTPIAVWKFDDLAASSDDAGHPHQHNYNNVLCHPYKILGKGIHTSTVKGVTFDPAGTYLASSGDDPSVCIWRAHDDWGLERKIDASSGIFRRWNNASGNNASQVATTLSSQSLFRRLSWSTDGAYICATNASVKNKHVASTVSREGWTVSGSKSAASGAVNLVGHKQPVVACRHCPYLLNNNNNSNDKDNEDDGEDEHDDDNDGEPDYSTLLALGDKRGFVTVWSTRKSRPIFKIQCSETRCTVTDLAWGRCSRNTNDNNNNNNNNNSNNNSSSGNKSDGDLVLLVSLLDGQVVALRFGIPDEFGRLLSARDQARVFQLRYGIDLNDAGHRLGDPSGRPKLIENALQFALEHETAREEEEDDEDDDDDENNDNNNNANSSGSNRPEIAAANQQPMLTPAEIQKRQLESRSKGGKKRIQPLLMMQTTPLSAPPPSKKQKVGDKASRARASADTLETALELAEKAASGAAAVTAAQKTAAKSGSAVAQTSVPQQQQHQQYQHQHQHQHHLPQTIQLLAGAKSTPQIPHSTDRIHSVDLPLPSGSSRTLANANANGETRLRYVADCTNSIRIPRGSSGSALPCTVLSISQGGKTMWNDQLTGSSCSSIAASESWLAVGTSDGCLQMYGTSPTMGWKSASAFRSHPPLVLGRPIVALHLRENENKNKKNDTELLVVSSDGRFAVYGLEPRIRLRYKGSLLPAMTHMLLSADLETDLYLPKLARIQLTETNRLLLLLSLHSASTAQGRNPSAEEGRTGRGANHHQGPCVGAGGSLQGFVYDLPSELWMRVADSRFVLSDFYNSLPSFGSSSKKKASPKGGGGPLSELDDSVRMGAGASSLQRSRRSRSLLDHHPASIVIAGRNSVGGDASETNANNDVDSRSHCEDRMACALALGSAPEFEFWFSMYVKVLSLTGNESLLRLVIDMLLGNPKPGGVGADAKAGSPCQNGRVAGDDARGVSTCWWLSESPEVLGFDRVKLVKTVVIPEMSKNRALQRITNEIAVEVEMLSKE